MPRPPSRGSSRNSSIIWTWMVTSRALVGSSADREARRTRDAPCPDEQRAGACHRKTDADSRRCAWPATDPHPRQHGLHRLAHRTAPPGQIVITKRRADLIADTEHRIERGLAGSPRHHGNPPPAPVARISASLSLVRSVPSSVIEPSTMRSLGFGRQPRHREGWSWSCRIRLSDHLQGLRPRRPPISHHRPRAPRRASNEMGLEVLDLEQGGFGAGIEAAASVMSRAACAWDRGCRVQPVTDQVGGTGR